MLLLFLQPVQIVTRPPSKHAPRADTAPGTRPRALGALESPGEVTSPLPRPLAAPLSFLPHRPVPLLPALPPSPRPPPSSLLGGSAARTGTNAAALGGPGSRTTAADPHPPPSAAPRRPAPLARRPERHSPRVASLWGPQPFPRSSAEWAGGRGRRRPPRRGARRAGCALSSAPARREEAPAPPARLRLCPEPRAAGIPGRRESQTDRPSPGALAGLRRHCGEGAGTRVKGPARRSSATSRALEFLQDSERSPPPPAPVSSPHARPPLGPARKGETVTDQKGKRESGRGAAPPGGSSLRALAPAGPQILHRQTAEGKHPPPRGHCAHGTPGCGP